MALLVTGCVAGDGHGGRASALGQWYASTSAFNTEIPANPPIHPDSAQMVKLWAPNPSNPYSYYWLGPRGGPGEGSAPAVAYPSKATPPATVQVNYPNCSNRSVQVPISRGLKISAPPHENKLVVMLANGDEWDFFDITPPGATPYDLRPEGGPASCPVNKSWQAATAVRHRPGWTGSGSTSLRWSDSNIPFGAGIIRLRDTRNARAGGTWGHALIIVYSGNCAGGQAHPAYVYPASGSDGRATGISCAPMGSRWQLDPSINCNTWPSMAGKPTWLKQMCRTLQVYGAITGHSTLSQGDGDGIWTEWYGNFGSAKYPWQDPTTGAWPSDYSPQLDLPSDLLSHFRVIDWTKWRGAPDARSGPHSRKKPRHP
jgi:hypothetical protein